MIVVGGVTVARLRLNQQGDAPLSNWIAALFQRLFSRGRSRLASRPGKPAMTGEIDQEMHEVFVIEFDDLCKRADAALKAWHEDFSNPAHTRALARAFHTLKGSAPIIGATQLAELGRVAEHASKFAGRKRNPDLALIEALDAAVALMPHWLHAIRDNLAIPEDTRSVISTLQRASR